MDLGSIRRLWSECSNTDEPENESRCCVGSSSLATAKDLVVSWAHPCMTSANWGPKAVYA